MEGSDSKNFYHPMRITPDLDEYVVSFPLKKKTVVMVDNYFVSTIRVTLKYIKKKKLLFKKL